MLSVTFRRSILVLGVVSGLAISGCAAPNNPDVATTPTASSSTQAAVAPETDPDSSAALPLKPALTPVPDPASLVGYDGASLESLLGAPSFTRRDPPAELWQYRSETCTLDLFLYEESSGVYSVEHLEFREAIVSKIDMEHCLRAIIEQKLADAAAA